MPYFFLSCQLKTVSKQTLNQKTSATQLVTYQWECLLVWCGSVHSGCCRLSLPFEQKKRPLPFFSGGYWTDPCAHISKLLWDFSKEIFYKSVVLMLFLAFNSSFLLVHKHVLRILLRDLKFEFENVPHHYRNEWKESQNLTFKGHSDVNTVCIEIHIFPKGKQCGEFAPNSGS